MLALTVALLLADLLALPALLGFVPDPQIVATLIRTYCCYI